jgi:hypothetical protein
MMMRSHLSNKLKFAEIVRNIAMRWLFHAIQKCPCSWMLSYDEAFFASTQWVIHA